MRHACRPDSESACTFLNVIIYIMHCSTMYIYVYMCVHMYTSRQGEGQLYGEVFLIYSLSSLPQTDTRVPAHVCLRVCARCLCVCARICTHTYTERACEMHSRCGKNTLHNVSQLVLDTICTYTSCFNTHIYVRMRMHIDAVCTYTICFKTHIYAHAPV